MLKRTSLAVAAALTGTCLSAHAADDYVYDGRFYVAPQVSYGFFDDADNTDLDDGEGYGVAVGKPLGKYFNLEAHYFQFDDVDIEGTSNSADQDGYGLTGLYFPAPETSRVFLLGGYSVGDYEVDGANVNEDADHIDAGFGYMKKITDYGLALRGEYRYRNTDVETIEDDFDNHIVSLSLQIPLGAPPTGAEPEPEPATPEPAPEPIDSDNDGVNNSSDQCPGTPSNTEVNSQGCPAEKSEPIVLKGVTFEFDSAKLTSEAENRLDNVVNALKSSPDLDVRVEGHTDSVGSADYNRELSQQRADSVKRYLVDHGIAASRLTTRGFGESEPVATNDTEAGRAKNRRVELESTDE